MRNRARIAAVTCGVVGLVMAGTAGTASAKETHAAHPAVGAHITKAASTAVPAKATEPKGYTVVDSAAMDSPNGEQVSDSVACPSGTVPLGGGVTIASDSVDANINESFPESTGWGAAVDNTSGADTDFSVWAVCAKTPKGYTQVAGDEVDNPAGTQTEVFAECPSGTKVLGGGATDTSTSTSVNLNETIPYVTKKLGAWTTFVNNASDTDEDATGYAICGKVAGYSEAVGSTVDNPAGAQTEASVACPSGTVVLGGGAAASSDETSVSINTSEPAGANWLIYESNGSAYDNSITAYTTCGS